MAKAMRKIVRIDPDKCNGCGECVPACAEGAIQIINGKASLVGEILCDGLGACLGTCPQDAITIEQRPAEVFDEHAVQQHKHTSAETNPPSTCPGATLRKLMPTQPKPSSSELPAMASQLGHWPVQLALVPTQGDIWRDADVLIAADCVAIAMPDFHQRLLAGHMVAVACPKLDDVEPYIEKLSEIFATNDIRSITVAHMEVPCCRGLLSVVHEALQRSGQDGLAVHEITVGIDGNIVQENSTQPT